MALAMQRHPCQLEVYTPISWMLEARREDLRAIWDALPVRPTGLDPSFWTVEDSLWSLWTAEGCFRNKSFEKACAGPNAEEESEDTWMQLLEILDQEVEWRQKQQRLLLPFLQ